MATNASNCSDELLSAAQNAVENERDTTTSHSKAVKAAIKNALFYGELFGVDGKKLRLVLRSMDY